MPREKNDEEKAKEKMFQCLLRGVGGKNRTRVRRTPTVEEDHEDEEEEDKEEERGESQTATTAKHVGTEYSESSLPARPSP